MQSTPPRQPGQQFDVLMQWRTEEAPLVTLWAVFLARVEAVDEGQMRVLCRLVTLAGLRTSLPPDQVPPGLLASVHGLVGQCALLPYEAAGGLPLNLKVATLLGEHPFFFPPEQAAERLARGAQPKTFT